MSGTMKESIRLKLESVRDRFEEIAGLLADRCRRIARFDRFAISAESHGSLRREHEVRSAGSRRDGGRRTRFDDTDYRQRAHLLRQRIERHGRCRIAGDNE